MRSEILRYVSHGPIPITPKKLATSLQSGQWPSSRVGRGFDFRSHREYQLGDDPRSIHTGMTVRTGKKMIVERIAMQDVNVLVVLDCSPSMGVRRKADILMAISLMLLFSGVSIEMRVGAALLVEDGYRQLGMGTGLRHALRLFTKVEEVCALLKNGQSITTGLPKTDVSKLVPANSILLYLSDFLDEKGYARDNLSFSVEARRYDFIPIVIQDEFEHTFPDLPEETMFEFLNPETGYSNPVWIGSQEKDIIKKANEKRFSDLRLVFSSRGIKYMHVATPAIEKVHKILSNFFASR